MHRDPQFAAQVARLQQELDRRGAQNLLIHAPGAETVIGVNSGVVVRDGHVHIDQRPPDPADLSADPPWIKAAVGLGMILAVAGLGLFGHTLFTWNPQPGSPDFTDPPDGFGSAAAVFFVGFVLVGIGWLGRAMTKPKPTR
jgi:hypothetical protein